MKVDYKAEEKRLVQSLIDDGHERILYINHSENNILNENMLNGYREAISNNEKKSYIIETEGISSDDGYNIGKKVYDLVKKEEITAITCVNDNVAIGFINYCIDNNISVPDDLSVAGFGDSSVASIYRPKLSTVSIPYYDIGAISIRALIKRIKEEEDILEDDWIIDGQIVKRESTKSIK